MHSSTQKKECGCHPLMREAFVWGKFIYISQILLCSLYFLRASHLFTLHDTLGPSPGCTCLLNQNGFPSEDFWKEQGLLPGLTFDPQEPFCAYATTPSQREAEIFILCSKQGLYILAAYLLP